MAAPLDAALVTFRMPLAYSFCASMIMRAESEGDAVLGGMPRSWRKDFVAMLGGWEGGVGSRCQWSSV